MYIKPERTTNNSHFVACITILLLLSMIFKSGYSQSYSPDESLCKGDTLVIPLEFREGFATLRNIKQWSSSIALGCCYIASGEQLLLDEINVDNEPEREVIVRLYQAQNSGYMIFKKTKRGYIYLGLLEYALIRLVQYAHSETSYILTTSNLGGEFIIVLHTLRNGKMKAISHTIRLKSDDKDGELYKKLFEKKINEGKLRDIFHLDG